MRLGPPYCRKNSAKGHFPYRQGPIAALVALLILVSCGQPEGSDSPVKTDAGSADSLEKTTVKPVITADGADRVQSLFLPHRLGDSFDGDWKWVGLSIEKHGFSLRLEAPDGAITIAASHPDVPLEQTAGVEKRTTSFSYRVDSTRDSPDEAARPLLTALEANDDGTFWGEMHVPQAHRPEAARVEERRSGQDDTRGRTLPPHEQQRRNQQFSLAVLLGLALLVVLVDRRPRLSLESAPRVGFPPLATWGMAAAFAVLLFVAAPSPTIESDTLRDISLAMDCATGGMCFGPETSFRGMQQGAGWTRLLALLTIAGGEPSHLLGLRLAHALVLLVHALAFVLFHNEARRWIGPHAALPATALFALLMVLVVEVPYLNNPSLASLPIVLFFAGAAFFVAERRTRWLILAVLGCALSLETHPLNAALGPPLLFVAAACSATPFRAVALAGGIPLASMWLLGQQALLRNMSVLTEMGALFPLLGACLVVVSLGFWSRGRLANLSQRRRVAAVLTGVAGVSLAFPVLLSLVTGKGLIGPYVQPAMVAVPVLATPMLLRFTSRPESRARRQWGSMALSALLIVTYMVVVTRPQFTYEDMLPLTRAIYERGETWNSIARPLHDPEYSYPRPPEAAGPRETLPATPTPENGRRFLLTAESTWEPPEFDPGWSRRGIGNQMMVLHSRIDRWIRPVETSTADDVEGTDSDSTTRRLAIRARDRDDSPLRHVQVLPSVLPQAPTWRIVAVEGVGYRGTLPASEIVLVQEEPTEGVLILEQDSGSDTRGHHGRSAGPSLFETHEEERRIREFIRQSEPRRYVASG